MYQTRNKHACQCTANYLRQRVAHSRFQTLAISQLHVRWMMWWKFKQDCIQNSRLLANKPPDVCGIVRDDEGEYSADGKQRATDARL